MDANEKTSRRSTVVLCLAALAAFGCSGSPQGSPAGDDGGPPDGGEPDGDELVPDDPDAGEQDADAGEGPDARAPEGENHLFAWGAARPDENEGMMSIMRSSIADVVSAFEGTRGAPFVVNQSTDPATVTSAWVREQLDVYAETLSAEDTFVFYAHTHGNDEGLPVLMISWEELADMLLEIPARNVVVFMMSCHSGRLTERLDAIADRWGDRAEQGRNLLVFTAVNASETAIPADGISPLPTAVSRAVRPGGADGGGDLLHIPESWDGSTQYSGAVSMEELRQYVPFLTSQILPERSPQFTGAYAMLDVFVQLEL